MTSPRCGWSACLVVQLARLAAFCGTVALAACSVRPVSYTPLGDDGGVYGGGLDAPKTARVTISRTGAATGVVSAQGLGLSCTETCTATVPVGAQVTLMASPDVGAAFGGWGGSCAGMDSTCTLTVTGDVAVTARFDVAMFTVNIGLLGSGGGMVTSTPASVACPDACTTVVPYGTAITLAASAMPGSTFLGWGGACNGTGACTFTATADISVTAAFAADNELIVMQAGSGGGTVSSVPAGISCGSDCTERYAPGTVVTLSAVAADDSTFTGWSGGCTGTGTCQVTLDTAAMVTATFALQQHTLQVALAGIGSGTVSSSPAGISCGTGCSTAYDAHTQVTLTAAPASNSVFTGWSGGGCAGTDTCVVTMDSAVSVTATFALKQFTVGVAVIGTGGGTVQSSPAGIACGPSCSAPYDFGTVVTLTASPDSQSTFLGWGGACSGTSACTFTVTADISVTAAFAADNELIVARAGNGGGTVSSVPTGIACGSDCTESYAPGTVVMLSAVAASDSTFTGWSGGCTGMGTCQVTVNAAAMVTATFALQQHTLQVALAGNGSGTVTSSPAGISCGTGCSAAYDAHTQVTLTAAPAANSVFTGWSGGGCAGTGTCVVTTDSAVSVTATFTLKQFAVSVAVTGTGGGTVQSSPAGIVCGPSCSAPYDFGTVVTLTASPNSQSTFLGWSGACSGTGACTFTVTAATSVTAAFAADNELIVARAGNGGGTVSSVPAGIACGSDCTESYAPGTVVTLSAVAAGDSTFTGWSGGCTGTGTCQVTMNAAVMVTATFALQKHTLQVALAGNGSGTVTSSPAGISCGTGCSAAYDAHTQVTLTAAAAADSVFTGWTGGCSGTGACVVTMDSAVSVTATFALKQFAVGVTVTGTGGGTVTSSPAGIVCPGICSVAYDAHTQVTLTASPAVNSVFLGWAGACSGTGACTFTVTAATSVTAAFAADNELIVARAGNGGGTVSSVPAGIACGSDCTESYAPGTVVTLSAVAAGDSTFTGWTGGCTGTGTCQVTMNAAVMVTATFALQKHTLQVALAGNGSGTVTSSPAGISCGTGCSAAYDAHTQVTLTAAPAANSVFTGWSGGGCAGTGTCVVTTDSAISVTATFTLKQFTVSVAVTGTGGGTVTSSPAGISCGSSCSALYNVGTVVTLTASPNSQSTFLGWSGACSGTGACTFTVTAATSVTAAFAADNELIVARAGNGSGTVTSVPAGISCGSDCTESYAPGTVVTLSAVAAGDSTFTGWSGGCTGTGTCQVTMNAAVMVTATFTLQKHTLQVVFAGTGSGTVTSSPAGISCSTGCSAAYDAHTQVTLTAAAASNSRFTGWSGGGCSGTGTCVVTMDSNVQVTASFTQVQQFTLTISVTGNGVVRSEDGDVVCTGNEVCSAPYDAGTVVTLQATGGTLRSWGGQCTIGSPNECQVTMTSAKSVTAMF